MENTKKPILSHIFNWSVIILLAMIAINLLTYFLGAMQNKFLGGIIFAIWIVLLFFAMKYYRDAMHGVELSYGKALVIGILITSFVAVGLTIFNYMLYKYIAPDYYSTIVEMAELSIIEQELPLEVETKALEISRRFMSIGWMTLFSFFGAIFQGIIASLLAAIFGKGISEANEETDTNIE